MIGWKGLDQRGNKAVNPNTLTGKGDSDDIVRLQQTAMWPTDVIDKTGRGRGEKLPGSSVSSARVSLGTVQLYWSLKRKRLLVFTFHLNLIKKSIWAQKICQCRFDLLSTIFTPVEPPCHSEGLFLSHQLKKGQWQVQFTPLRRQKTLSHISECTLKVLLRADWIFGLGLVWYPSGMRVLPIQVTQCGSWRRGWMLWGVRVEPIVSLPNCLSRLAFQWGKASFSLCYVSEMTCRIRLDVSSEQPFSLQFRV